VALENDEGVVKEEIACWVLVPLYINAWIKTLCWLILSVPYAQRSSQILLWASGGLPVSCFSINRIAAGGAPHSAGVEDQSIHGTALGGSITL